MTQYNLGLIEQILALPNAPQVLKAVEDTLKEEKRAREKFYNEISEFEKAEFINGQVVIHSPVKKAHNASNGLLFGLINAYVNLHNLGFVGVEKIMISLTRNDYEPDICFFKQEKANGFTADQVLFPAPDFVVEFLSQRTEKNDRGVKFEDYQAHGIEEYWIIDPLKKVVEQYRLEEGEYELILKSTEGDITCRPIKGFRIPISSIFDPQENLKTLAILLQS